MRWWSSDLHLGHKRIIELCDRPYPHVDAMNAALLDNINDRVAVEDSLELLGDTAMGNIEESLRLLRRVKCRVTLWPGNHDRFSLPYYRRAKGTAQDHWHKRKLAVGQAVNLSGASVVEDRAPSQWETRIGHMGHLVNVSHYPYQDEDRHSDKYAEWLPKLNAHLPLIHGHVHESWRANGRQFNVGVDANEFAPVSEDTLAEWIVGLPTRR